MMQAALGEAWLQLQVGGDLQQAVVRQRARWWAPVLQPQVEDAAILAAESLGDADRLRLAFAQCLGVHVEQVFLDHFLGAAEHRHAPGLEQDRVGRTRAAR